MAFGSAVGWNNLPNGNFSPVIYSKQVQLAFRKAAVCEGITNSDYFGEIANMGDSVKIIKEPEISVNAYLRGTTIVPQAIADADFSLTIDKANYFAFKVDDIEEAHSHVNFQQLSSDRAAYRLADQFDQDVLGYLSGYSQSALHANADTVNTTVNGTKANTAAGSDELLAANKLDASDFNGGVAAQSIGIIPRAGTSGVPSATGTANPLQIIARMARKLDEQDVDSRGRWIVIDPVLKEILMDEESRLLDADFGGSGLHTTGGTNATNFGVIVAGHDSAVATAEQINKTETYRDPDSFADIVRGMHLYGRKILRPEALVNAVYNLA
jgi:hypothetical protein